MKFNFSVEWILTGEGPARIHSEKISRKNRRMDRRSHARWFKKRGLVWTAIREPIPWVQRLDAEKKRSHSISKTGWSGGV